MPNSTDAEFNSVESQWSRLLTRIVPDDWERMRRVYALASRVHAGQTRKTAEGAASIPYLVHPLRVANVVAHEWKRTDFETLAACLLHDTIEDVTEKEKPTLPNEIREIAGNGVLDAVFILTKPELPQPCPPDAKAQRDARYFAAVRAAPEWVRLIKCSDRVDNLRDALRWGSEKFWAKYSSETLGWHLWLARETAPIAEMALFAVLVEGERKIRGRVPVWADGNLIDPSAAVLLPEAIARQTQSVGLALRGDTLIVGVVPPVTSQILQTLRDATSKFIHPIEISVEAISDAHAAKLFGAFGE
jgi:hypothetical protein